MIPETQRPSRGRSLAVVLASGFSALLCSCGDAKTGQATLHPASGQVLFQGKPLAGVQVTFRPASLDTNAADSVPMAQTDEAGKFRLATFLAGENRASDGAPAGDYIVAISTPMPSDSIGFLRADARKASPDVLKGRFANPQTSGLKATIKNGGNTFAPFDLK
jgi:hypothetical protein